jgi:signal transduction histidine kinase
LAASGQCYAVFKTKNIKGILGQTQSRDTFTIQTGRQIFTGLSDKTRINPKHFGCLFESFEQVEGSAQRSGSGTGLGLSVSKQLVELHGGQISVDTEFGHGSTFCFTLPVSTKKPTADIGTKQAVSRLHVLDDITV